MESSGERLKKARLEKGLSLEEAHKKTKIHLNILRSIEEDSLINFSPIYIKGFLKIYANFLGVDPKELVPFSRDAAAEKKISLTRDARSSFLKRALFTLDGFKPRINLRVLSLVALASIFLIGLFYLGKVISTRRTSGAGAVKLRVILPKNKGDMKVQTLKTQARFTANGKQKNQYIKTASQKNFVSGVTLSMYAKEDCWVQIRLDGKLMGRNILKKGKTETWRAKEKIEFSLNNAAAVDLEINNKSIPSIGRRNQAIKNALIDKEGLIKITR